ncbi:MAG: hypothetical protein AB9835_07680 [Eubacteriales bacterium]
MDYNNNDRPQGYDPNYKLYNVLSYIGILFVVGLIAAPNDPRCKHHLNNGIMLALIWFIYGIVSSVVGAILGVIAIIPVLGWIIASVGGTALFALFVIIIIANIKGIVDAATDKEEPLMIIGKYIGNFRIIK